MCAPVVAAIPAIGGLLTTGAGATAAYSATGLLTALSLATTGASLYAQNSTAKAQAANIANQQDRETEEVIAKGEEELGARIRESRERRARARVAAGESGALGASFAASINQSVQDQNADAALVSKNVAFAQRGIDDRANTALSQIRSTSSLEAGLQLATAGMSGYRTGLGIEALKNNQPKE